jgi:hypothetical protein
MTMNKIDQAEQLLTTFFPPLPARIEEEGERPQRRAVSMPDLTLEEIEVQVMAAKPWKAPGDDGVPAMVWRRLWPVVKYRVLTLFGASLRDGRVPRQWRRAKIIPLRKPDKGDYTEAKAWRPISLLSTLGKIMEAVIAERISYAVETYGLLPANHFGARKRRSAEQALLLLQEQIYKAWRARKVLSLISFDVKGAYNGVCKERLLARMKARGIPDRLIRWVEAFCSDRAASIVVNGQASEIRELPQAGLPQGSPLSPILFLFFNADLVQRRIKADGGSIAFIDDYSAWVTGPTADANRTGIQSIIEDALEWEKRSGATFEADKTTVIHFTRVAVRNSAISFLVKGKEVKPSNSAKVLGVVMDVGLRYQEHMAAAAARGLTAAMCLRRLKMLSPKVARQLFVATVAPTVDYASNVWMHACRAREAAWLNKVQLVGAQAITGAFRTVATAVAEAEACIHTVKERHRLAATRLCVNLRTLPGTHPLAALRNKASKRFLSPMQTIASWVTTASTDRMEIIREFALPPWTSRIPVLGKDDFAAAAKAPSEVEGIIIATSSSVKNGMVGMGGVVHDTTLNGVGGVLASYSVTLGPSDEQNPYTAELAAVAMALRCMPRQIPFRDVTVISSNLSAGAVIKQPRQQSGQCTVLEIYDEVKRLRQRGCSVRLMWVPAKGEGFALGAMAKVAAQRATEMNCIVETPSYQAKSTTLHLALAQRQPRGRLPENVGKHSKYIDTALPGKHTRALYDSLKRKESDVLVQLRTGMTRLNGHLHRIGAVESELCECGQATETIEHFLFRCKKWTMQREIMLQCSRTKIGNLSFFLGGKSAANDDKWKPDMQAVRAAIAFTLATKRLEADQRPATR